MPMSASGSRRGSMSSLDSAGLLDVNHPETLENLLRATHNHESIIQAYYTNSQGEVVTLSVYDISDADPADIIGNDVLNRTHAVPDDFDAEDFDEAVARRLERLNRRQSLRSGDSNHELS